MDDTSYKKNKTLESVVAAINMAAMGAAVALEKNFRIPNADVERVERKLDDLSQKIDGITEQLRSMHVTSRVQTAPFGTVNADKADKKAGVAPEAKSQDLIYVKKPSEFPFYS